MHMALPSLFFFLSEKNFFFSVLLFFFWSIWSQFFNFYMFLAKFCFSRLLCVHVNHGFQLYKRESCLNHKNKFMDEKVRFLESILTL